MVGQKNLLNTISLLIDTNSFPRFSIITGLKGSGKKTLADIIPTLFVDECLVYKLPDVKIDTIKDMIKQSYKVSSKVFYIISDADNMSIPAKNALLKVTEEPPNNAYFIMTLNDIEMTLPTIKSRAIVFNMDIYLPDDIYDYSKMNYGHLDADVTEIIIDIAETPLEVNQLIGYGVIAFYDYVELVVSNIAEVSGANSFKIADKIELSKEDADKYDLRLFWKIFMKICLNKMRDTNDVKYSDGIRITSKAIQELGITGVNKQMLFDTWLLNIRESWM